MQIQKLKPTAENAQLLAALYLKRDNYTQAIEFLNQAIGLEKTDSLKASYYHDIGFIYCHKLKQYAQARTNANEAIKHRHNWGNPYILIGDAYASSSASFGGDSFTNAAVFWAAVDKYYKAKSIDPEVEKLANQKIAYYSNYFPKNEDSFMQGYSNGASYKVGGWINETTTVRVRK